MFLQGEGDLDIEQHTHTQREDDYVKKEAEIDVMQLQAKECQGCQQSPEAKKKTEYTLAV